MVIDDKTVISVAPVTGIENSSWKDDGVDDNAQIGVKKAQATTLTWTRTALYTTLSW